MCKKFGVITELLNNILGKFSKLMIIIKVVFVILEIDCKVPYNCVKQVVIISTTLRAHGIENSDGIGSGFEDSNRTETEIS